MNYLNAEMNIFESTSIVHDETEEAQQLQQQQQQLNEQVYVSLRSMHALNARQSDEQLTQILQSRMQANSQIMDDMRTRHASNKVNNNNNNHNDNTTTIITEQSSQYSNIPFVQIHTTDVRPQHNNYGNSFRRPATNAETIKSEPIKSETSEGIIKENNNTNNNNHNNNNNNNNNNNSSNSNVPLTKTTNNDNENGIEKISKNVSLEDENSNCVGTSQKTPRVFKCTKCHLLTLTQRDLAFHMQHAHTDHGIPRRLVACPGCENKFFSLAVLELHFREDHLMSEPDVLILMNGVDFLESEDEDDLFEQFENNEQPVEMIADKNANALESQSKEMSVPTTAETIAVENHNVEQQQQQQHQNQTKSRIYLRNVECLREPRALREQQVEAATSHQPEFLDNFFPTHTPIDFDVLTFSNSEFLTSENIDINVDLTKIDNRNINNKNKIHDSNIIKSLPIVDVERKQKISIKSVELLCKPDMLENNYGGNFINKPPVSAVNTETFDDLLLPTQAATTTVPTVMCELEPARPARPKIYIKNVDILKEPFLSPEFFKPTLSNLPSMNFNFLSTPTNTTNCEDTLNPLNNFLTPTVPTINNLNSFMPDNLYTHLVDMEEPNLHTIVTEQQTTVSHSQQEDENSLLENNILSESDLLLPMLNDHLYEQPDQAQPTEYSTFNGGTSSRQKIFIKNVEVLKEPQMQEPRGTLHLRTVDELNLMNKREVENLIAPNLEQNYEQSEPDHNFLNNSEIEDEIAHHMNNSNDSTISIDLLLNRTGSWTQGIECDLPDNNECFTTISSSAEMEHERVKSSTPLSMEMSANNSNKFNGFPSNTDVLHEGAISLRAIDELTDVPHDVPQDVPASCDAFMFQESAEGNDLYELANAEVMPDVMLSNNKPKNAAVLETTHNLPPPLVPMSNNSILTVAEATTNRNVPLVALPPLVPVSNSVRLTTIHQNQAKEVKENSNVENNGVFLKSVRGRPYGPKKPLGTPTTKAKPATKSNKKQHLDTREKCSVKGCRYRFSKQETLMYHQRCHTSDGKNERLICPECGFSCKTWNALHTHLWRLHDIDMELYFCKICSFKTPIYSRLANIHMKIHSDERGYKCEQCDKAFKNSKQLKNHRRWHRLHPNKPHSSTTTATKNQTTNLHDCNDGMQAFPTELALSMHNCKQKVPLKCKKCDLTFLSHHLLKMHALVHDESDQKRLQCNQCEFNCTDYNSLRRHKMRHNQTKKYNCPHCTAKFIQSCSFQKHIKQKHAEHMSTTLCICNFCPFTTISMSLYRTHMAKHNADDEAINIEVSQENARGVSS